MTADRDRVITLLEQLLDAAHRQVGLLEAMAQANEPALYCPPNDHCPGGVRLMRSTVFADDMPEEKRKDRFYHPLPEREWHDIETKQGTLHVKHHNVWRSAAIAVRSAVTIEADEYDADDEAYPPYLDDEEGPGDHRAAYVEAAPRAAAGPPSSATAAPARAEPAPSGSEPRVGQWLTDVLRDLRMNGSDVREAGGFPRNSAASELLEYPGGLAELYAQCEQWAVAKGRIAAPVGAGGAK